MAQNSRLFREKEVMAITALIKEGESCALVAIGNSGKSRLLQYLLKRPVREKVFGDGWEQYLLVYVDGNGLLEDTAWGLFEEMLDSAIRAVREARDIQPDSDLAQALAALQAEHMRMVDDPRLAYRWLAHAVRTLFQEMGFTHVAFLLDDIDRLFAKEDHLLFRQLKSLRDHHKDHLCYVVAARRPIDRLCENEDDLKEIGGFVKLVRANTFALGPYAPEDAEEMLRTLMRRVDFILPPEVGRVLYHQSGLHPGLLRAAFFALKANETRVNARMGSNFKLRSAESLQYSDPGRLAAIISEVLASDPDVRGECYNIWERLDQSECDALTKIIKDKEGKAPDADKDAMDSLIEKRLLIPEADSKYRVFSELFKRWVIDERGLQH